MIISKYNSTYYLGGYAFFLMHIQLCKPSVFLKFQLGFVNFSYLLDLNNRNL